MERVKSSKDGFAKRHSHILFPVGAVILVLLIWQVVTVVFHIEDYLLPSPSAILKKMFVERALLWQHTLVTLFEILLGFLLSVVIGVLLAVLIVFSRSFERAVYPLLVASQAIPKVAIAPLLIVWMGFGLSPKILVAFLVAFFPIVVDTVVGLRSTTEDMIYLIRTMGGTRIQTLTKVILPNALPSIFAGLKVAITLSVVGAIVGEFVASDRGLGYLLMFANGQMLTTLLFAITFVLSVVAIVLFYFIEVLENILVPWKSNNEKH